MMKEIADWTNHRWLPEEVWSPFVAAGFPWNHAVWSYLMRLKADRELYFTFSPIDLKLQRHARNFSKSVANTECCCKRRYVEYNIMIEKQIVFISS